MSESRGYIDLAAVKAAVPLEKILIHYGILEKLAPHGAGLRGCCPIHKGDDPKQFSVTLERNLWNCFSQCKSGGNMLAFVMAMEDCGLLDAAWKVNDWFDLRQDKMNKPPVRATPKEKSQPKAKAAAKPESSKLETAKPAVEKTAKPELDAPEEETGENTVLDFSLDNLDGTHPYLMERGLSAETIAHFGIGYCPKGIMAGRVAIPIHNAAGQIVANAGRWPGETPEGKEKYRLPGKFRKTLEVFNLHRAAAESDASPLVIVEGFFPVMHLWQHGIRRAVSLMGWHMSARQEERIAATMKPDSRIVLMMDNDEAGIVAKQKLVTRLAEYCFVRAFLWPDGVCQPDELTEEQLARLKP